MRALQTRSFDPRMLLAVMAAVTIGTASAASAAVVSYQVTLDALTESPPNASAGLGAGQVDIDATAHTMHVHVVFSGLSGTVTASHIHAATAVAGAGTAGVATTTPTFAGFPSGVTGGTYDNTLDLTLASSYNPSYVTANGGTPAAAEAALLAAIASGKAYWNIHTNVVPSGEIRGFLVPGNPTPADQSTWGRIKTLYK